MKQLVNSIVLLFFSCGFLSAQVNVKFVAHLSTLALKTEHYTYLTTVVSSADSLAYYKAQFYLTYFNDSLFIENSLKSKYLVFNDTLLKEQATLKFLQSQNNFYQKEWFNINSHSQQTKREKDLFKIYQASQNPSHFNTDSFPPELKRSFINYKRSYRKKPWLGALFSLAVPGLGKLYAGKPNSALAAFVLNAGYAVQSIESGAKLGVQHPLTVINLCFFTAFYAANIYGSYKSVAELKRQRQKQFLKDAANNYN